MIAAARIAGAQRRGPIAHLWRDRATARVRLAALLTSLFLIAGVALLSISYALVRHDLTLNPTDVLRQAAAQQLAGGLRVVPGLPGDRGGPPPGLRGGPPAGLRGGPPPGLRGGPPPGVFTGPESPPPPTAQGAPGVGLGAGLVTGGQTGPPPGFAVVATPGQVTLPAIGGSVQFANTKLDSAIHRVQQQVSSQTLHRLFVEYMIALIALAVVAALGGWLLAGRVLRPLKRISRTARSVSHDNLSQRIAHVGPDDELKELADTFDQMLARLEGAFERQRVFIANASHELRTPLTIIRTEADVALTAADPQRDELLAGMRVVRAATTRSDRLIGGLLTLARIDKIEQPTTVVDLGALAAGSLDEAQPAIEALGLRVDRRIEPAVVHGDRRLLETLLRNLIDNAVRYNQPGGDLAVSTGVDPTNDGACVLRVANSGDPIPVGVLAGMTEPFQRLAREQHGDGVGLGLSIVEAIVDSHDGQLMLTANDGGGLRVEVALPAGARPRARPLVAPAEPEPTIATVT